MPSQLFKFEAIIGFFSAADPSFRHVKEQPAKFGLLDKSEEGWTNLKKELERLQSEAEKENAIFKLIYLGRHGQGFHNLKAESVGEKAFIEKWAREYTDGETTWGPDPSLTDTGKQQARNVHDLLMQEKALGMPMPTTFYVSPLQRACQTHSIVYSSIPAAASPTVIDNLREGLNICIARQWKVGKDVTDPNIRPVFTDNIRSTKTTIHERFPDFKFEPTFTEEDKMWSEEYTESVEEHAQRTVSVLEQIFAKDEAEILAINAHGGTCLTFQQILNLPLQLPHVCAVLPLIIRATPC